MEEKYRIFFESSRDAIMLLAPPDWLFTAGNKATLEMFGAKNKKEFSSKKPSDLSPEYQPDGQLSTEKARKVIGKAMRNGSFFFEWKHKKINGEEFPANVLLTRIELDGKKLLLATVRDITETKKTEQELQKYRDHLEKIVEERTTELQESEEKYHAIIENASEAILVVQDSVIRFANPQSEALYGYSQEELVSRLHTDFIHKKDREMVEERHKERIKEKKLPASYPFRIVNKTGDIKWVELKISPFIWNGKPATLCFLSDITERKRIEKKLMESEEYFEKLFLFAPDAYYLNDLKGNFINGNKAAEKLMGYNKEELIGKSFLTLKMLPVSMIPKAAALLTKNFLGKPTGPDEFLLNRKDKSQVDVEILTFPMEIKGKIQVLGIARDITIRKKAEKELRESQKHFQELNTTKNKFFSILGHDLRSPFNSIIGFSEMLCHETDAFSREEIKEMAESIYNTSQETYNLLNNLLEWSRTQTGKIKFDPAKTGIYNSVLSTVDLLSDTAKKKNITILIDIPEQIQVFADLNMINTVIRNLLSNAIKFTQKKGSIKISAQDSGKFVEIIITDTGVGIKKKDVDKLFRIDENFSTIGTANEKGTGLGLILCKEFITMNNGDIRVESDIGKGSRFIISLPKEKES